MLHRQSYPLEAELHDLARWNPEAAIRRDRIALQEGEDRFREDAHLSARSGEDGLASDVVRRLAQIAVESVDGALLAVVLRQEVRGDHSRRRR